MRRITPQHADEIVKILVKLHNDAARLTEQPKTNGDRGSAA